MKSHKDNNLVSCNGKDILRDTSVSQIINMKNLVNESHTNVDVLGNRCLPRRIEKENSVTYDKDGCMIMVHSGICAYLQMDFTHIYLDV